MSFSKEIRKKIYDKYNGHCAYCGCVLDIKDMQIDHINSKYISEYYNEEIDNSLNNLNPSCRQCNFYKSTKSIEQFRHDLEDTIWHNLEKMFNYRLLKKYGQVEEHKTKIKFYFEEHC